MIMKIRTNYSLKKINTFGVDHNAKFFLSINNSDDIINFINYPNYQKEKKLILGGGSNILFTKDFDGVVLYNNIKGIEIIYQDEAKIKLKAKKYNPDTRKHELFIEKELPPHSK